MLPCFDVPSHPFVPHAPCASGFWFAAHQRWGSGGVGSESGGGGGVGASHRDTACSVNPGRDGSVARGGTATERRVQWAGGWLWGRGGGFTGS